MPLGQDTQFLRVVTVAVPTAGADFVATCPGEAIWRVLGGRFVFTTSAAVANRLVSLILDDQTDSLLQTPAGAVQAAGAAQPYSLFPGSPSASLAGAPWLLPTPTDGLVMLPGHRLRSSTALIDVGDQYSAIKLYVEQYPTGPARRVTPSVTSYATDKA